MTVNPKSSSSQAKPARVGLVTIFTGDGKGKTTAAIGTAVRAAGHGLRVFIVFFFKGKMFAQGEVKSLSQLPGVTTVSFGTTEWVKKGITNSEANAQAKKALEAAQSAVSSGRYDLVIMDEINSALDFGLIALDDVLGLIQSRPSHIDLILTGRNADKRVIDKADVVTEMVKVKHAYDCGVSAREGIDY